MAASTITGRDGKRAASAMTGRGGYVRKLVLLLALWGTAAFLLWLKRMYHTNAGVELSILLALTLMGVLLGQVPLERMSALVLYPMMVLEMVFAYHGFFPMVDYASVRVLLFMLDLGLLLWWQTGGLRKHFLGLSITGLTAAIFSLLSESLFNRLRPTYYYLGWALGLDPLRKTILLVAAALVMLGGYCLALRLLAVFLKRCKWSVDKVSRRFHELEPFLLLLVVCSILLWYVLKYVSLISHLDTKAYIYRYSNFSMFLLFFLDAVCFVLLMKAASINEKMHIAKKDRRRLLAYNSELEDTMDSLREIRHDVKNLLLTMGGFVERSGDQQMKEFYKKNIVPFMEHALVKNDLQSKLRILQDDCLKSFLYYKIMEKTEAGIPVSLELSSPVSLDRGYGDIIRLLGIFLDNAAEEAALAGGEVRIEILETPEGIQMGISNPVRQKTRERGVIAGTTDKGLGRGNGLLIAGKIIAGYDNILLNSYFTKNGFTQSLLITK